MTRWGSALITADRAHPDRRAIAADLRTALCVSHGVDPAEIDPATGHDLSWGSCRRAYASWAHHLGQTHGDPELHDRDQYEAAAADWRRRRPDFPAWPAFEAACRRAEFG